MRKLESLLLRLSLPRLCRLYGEQELESISELYSQKITPSNIISLLLERHGSQILANREIRIAVWAGLYADDQGYILDGRVTSGRIISKDEAEHLISSSWGRKYAITQRTLEVLGLDDTYLPPVQSLSPSIEFVNSTMTLFPHQKRLKDTLTRTLLKGEKRVLVHMPTGAGKTRTCLEAVIDYWRTIANRKGCIVWLAHSEELCDQAIDSFRELWAQRGDEPIRLVRFWGAHNPKPGDFDGSFVVVGLPKVVATISSEKADSEALAIDLMSKAELVVMDEAHKAIAPTYKMVLQNLIGSGRACLIGLTATPGRGTRNTDEDAEGSESRQLARYFNNRKLGLVDTNGIPIESPIEYLQDLGFLARLERKAIKTGVQLELTPKEQETVGRFLELPSSVLQKLANSATRNALILSEIIRLIHLGKQIIVFALTVEHANFLSDLLRLQSIKSRCITGQTSTIDRQEWINSYKRSEINVLVNFGVLTTGFDSPNTNAIVIARPTASVVLYSQMIGRAIRGKEVGGNETAILIDLEDNIAGFPSEAQAFNYFNDLWT
ncbi:Superfamily II DNA or RNA helicase [Limnobacter sp. 130]|uniref:DEAD/DEAH box helicase n=1 Tax=Limnobacter sp. 130 TaxID=2653147 RepID=UPI0012EF2C8F|nr:DEAD/DEAH box helicase [Limnobacter sp. 130]VWX37427.1 Superfamily II DNA or RNA helicase [Limnobacter sp. 130]